MAPAPGSAATTASSATPTPLGIFRHKRNSSTTDDADNGTFRDVSSMAPPTSGGSTVTGGLAPPMILGRDARSISNASLFGPRTASLANSTNAPGSFSSNLESTGSRSARPELIFTGSNERPEDPSASEKRQAEYRDKISKELKIKIGSENLLEALHHKSGKQQKDQLLRVETELQTSNRKIAELQSALASEIERSQRPSTPLHRRLSAIFQGSPLKSSSRQSIAPVANGENEDFIEDEGEAESPTFVLGEILQALEAEGMQPDYYVIRANTLVDLFKRHPTLKYDLAWSIFGLRVQMMLLSESREVVAAGYRVTRHAIGDRKSLQTIRKMNTDYLVCLSLAKDSKATIEREQALKFVRSFVDVKDGVMELSNAVIRAIVSVAEHHEDRLRNIALLTLTEILVRNPELLVRAGGMSPLTEALRDGTYSGAESIVAAFLYMFDVPQQRKFLFGGAELQGPFSIFSDDSSGAGHEERLKTCARSISAIINSWPGLFTLGQAGFNDISSLLLAVNHPTPYIQNLVLDLLFDLLHIKPPSWTSSFLAGRRLTTYGRVANLRVDPMEHQSRLENEDDLNRANLVDHYRCLVLAILVECGIVETLSQVTLNNEDQSLQRKATLLLNEVLKIADQSLSSDMSAKIQILQDMMQPILDGTAPVNTAVASDMVFQIDSVSKTLMRSHTRARAHSTSKTDEPRISARPADVAKPKLSVDMDEIQFRSLMAETQIPASGNYLKWKWDLINDIIEGPLLNPKRLEEAKATKFLKRLIAFYRPFKYAFSDIRNTKPAQRYVRIGCALMKSLVKTPEGLAYLYESKLMAQLAECLAQFDWMSNITSDSPLFSQQRLSETICSGYFNMLGAITSEPQGLEMLYRWKMINMMYHILDLKDRDDITQLLLGSMDFSLDSHLRVMLSKALTSAPTSTRIFATKLLRKYATHEPSNEANIKDAVAFWAIRLLVTQLYDPVIEVSEVAVEILQEACNRKQYLEYVVKQGPQLDHLGEIGAPLLLRFLSTSLGYKYLDGLGHITQEMDDWFLGRNEKYVTLVEASLARAFSIEPEKGQKLDENVERHLFGVVPPHFYRELTRTTEGCKLLANSGHFEEFVSTIKDFWEEDEDLETMLKVKGSLWAIGNVGSMELGAPFLERSNVVEWIVRIAEQSSVTTMRGTAFFVLGLISRSLHGSEILADKAWHSPVDTIGNSLGLVLPADLRVLFKLKKKVPKINLQAISIVANAPRGLRKDDPIETLLYKAVVGCGNTVMAPKELKDLATIRVKRRDLFGSVPVFRKVMYLLECHTIRLPLRQRIIDLFDKAVLRKIVLEYEDEEDSGDPNESEESAPNTARPPDTSKTVRPPEYARSSPEKVRTPNRTMAKSPAQRSPEPRTRRSDPPPPMRTPLSSNRPTFVRKKSEDES